MFVRGFMYTLIIYSVLFRVIRKQTGEVLLFRSGAGALKKCDQSMIEHYLDDVVIFSR